ncbi:ABC transporter permease [Haloimpatiens massiliensis]|uniref:ABC transporter permease n=1 Tax=Haloimpatiens massiliensis TaxID=1658110 RepID=UPI000C84C429|nr:ABC transporter permease [Haloimpatiens massiliensis]
MNRFFKFLGKHSSQILLLCVLFILCIFLNVSSEFFLTFKNIYNILESVSIYLILAIGMNFVIASGAIDLSAGSMVSLCGVAMALSMHMGISVGLSIIIGILCGAAMGFFNGAAIHFTSINAFVITLATASIYRGLALILTKGIPITKFPNNFLFFGKSEVDKINPSIIIAIIVFIVSMILMHKVKWGQYIKALGGNKSALQRVGVKCGIYRITCHMALGILASLVGLIITARLNCAEANAGLGMELDSITAVIMGGTLMSGGNAKLFGTAISVLLLGIIRNGLTILSVSSYYQQFFIGILLFFSVVFAEFRKRKKIQI